MLNYCIKINGIYDIICSLSILKIINIPVLSDLHISMIRDYDMENKIFERFFAYWIFTYGIIRLSNNALTPYSYYIESLFFFNEYHHSSLYDKKAIFVIISSLVLGILSHVSQSLSF